MKKNLKDNKLINKNYKVVNNNITIIKNKNNKL